jgi:hypothetical protein
MVRKGAVRITAALVALASLSALFVTVDSFKQLGQDFLQEKLDVQIPERSERLLPAVDYRMGDTSKIDYLFENNDGPTGLWDPCREIRLSVNPKYEPVGFRQVLEQELLWVSSRTGLKLEVVGETLEPPHVDRAAAENGKWKNVLVGFLPEKDFLSLANEIGYLDRTIGLGGPDVFPSRTNYEVFVAVSGILYFNTTWIEDELQTGNLNEGFGLNLSPLIRHEIGHLLGLDHFGEALMSGEGLSGTVNSTILKAFAMVGRGACQTSESYPDALTAEAPRDENNSGSSGTQSIDYLIESVNRSYEESETKVVTEYSGTWITINAPGLTEHYSSAQFWGPDDRGSLIMDGASNIYWVWQMLQEPNVRIAPSSQGFFVSHPNFIEIYVELENGLISKTARSDREYETIHKYEAVEPYLSRLLELEKEVVSTW